MSDPVLESHKIETYKSMITISIEVFKMLVLINGGAAAGMVAGMSNILNIISIEVFRWSIALFVVGLIFATFAVCFSWFTQNALHNENYERYEKNVHKWFVRGAIISCAASLTAFSAGAIVAAAGIHQPTHATLAINFSCVKFASASAFA